MTTNSRRPTKNRLWNAAESPVTWSLPVASVTIAEVIVPPGSSGLSVRPCGAPAATATTIVSPIARLVARISAATMPETAAGKTTRSDVVIFLAPRPYEASRRLMRHRAHRVLGHGGDERHRQDADADAGRGEVERVRVLEQRA